jgi:hypothetical protein
MSEAIKHRVYTPEKIPDCFAPSPYSLKYIGWRRNSHPFSVFSQQGEFVAACTDELSRDAALRLLSLPPGPTVEELRARVHTCPVIYGGANL